MEVYTWRCLPFPEAKVPFCSNYWIWNSASCPGSSFHCPCCHICPYIRYCWIHSHFLLSATGGNKLGEESDIHWLLVLWASLLDILLPKHCCDSVQCYSSFAFWHNHCHYSDLGTCDISTPCVGWYCWEK
jgi:hypothetical protein